MSSTIRIVSCCIVHCMQIHVTETKISKNIYPNCAYYNLVFSILFHLRKDFGCNLLNLFYSPLVDCAYELEKLGMECCRWSLGDHLVPCFHYPTKTWVVCSLPASLSHPEFASVPAHLPGMQYLTGGAMTATGGKRSRLLIGQSSGAVLQ